MEEQTEKTSNNFLDPERIVAGFGLKKGDHVVDFGAGHGYFTIPLARAVGGDGRVYAIDIQKPALDITRARAQSEHLLNIEYIRADLDEPQGCRLKDKFLDFVLAAGILFQSENRLAVAQEAYRILRAGGRLAVVEWGAAAPKLQTAVADPIHADIEKMGRDTIRSMSDNFGSGIGPPAEMRIKKEASRALAVQVGFEFDREFAAGSHHYGLLFIKK